MEPYESGVYSYLYFHFRRRVGVKGVRSADHSRSSSGFQIGSSECQTMPANFAQFRGKSRRANLGNALRRVP